ncbi:unnamed protein product [Calicophoron daubneyi]|uniref:phosphoacetylglucosamine mutase n=1 Tax=Calicophoron daubneyi TaxID=300641 RepID=A0AAV2TGU5_CALDB
MSSIKIAQTIASTLSKVSPPAPSILSYGTAGFRCSGNQLSGVVIRVGVLAALRSLSMDSKFVGLMITASHNPATDNGVKLIDPNGGMLQQEWEAVVEEFTHSPVHDIYKWLIDALEPIQNHHRPRVLLGYDTRESSVSLAQEAEQGIELLNGICLRLDLVTTPQLHYAVQYMNEKFNPAVVDPTPPNLDAIYTKRLADCFIRGLRKLAVKERGDVAGEECGIELHVDCAHGVGALALAKIDAELRQGGSPFRLRLHNTDIENRSLLNRMCGADYVKFSLNPPVLHSSEEGDVAAFTPSSRWATVDGDADRLLYFYISSSSAHPSREDGVVKSGGPIVLLDGDRIACLFASFIMKQLNSERTKPPLFVGVIQTAYSNAASTRYLTEEVHVPVVCVPTGVKYLHQAALEFDFGIYFEANGHGTILFSQAALDWVDQLGCNHPLSVLVSLTNTAVGDAISDILLVEYLLAWHKWSLSDWASIYTDLASRQIKVRVKNPRSITTVDAERRISSPAQLQDAVDEIVSSVDAANGQVGSSRAFVRPSGTENVARVYAESTTQPLADWLATKVAILTHQLADGLDTQPLADPGPMPF